MFLFNGVINKGGGWPYANPDFAKSEAVFCNPPRRMSDDAGGASLVFSANGGAEISGKIVGFAYSLDFFGFFLHQGKKRNSLLNNTLSFLQ